MWFVISSVQQRELGNRFFCEVLREFLLVGEIIAKRKEKKRNPEMKNLLSILSLGVGFFEI